MPKGYSASEIFKSVWKAFLLSSNDAGRPKDKHLEWYRCSSTGLHGLEASLSDRTVTPSLRHHPPSLYLCLFTSEAEQG